MADIILEIETSQKVCRGPPIRLRDILQNASSVSSCICPALDLSCAGSLNLFSCSSTSPEVTQPFAGRVAGRLFIKLPSRDCPGPR